MGFPASPRLAAACHPSRLSRALPAEVLPAPPPDGAPRSTNPSSAARSSALGWSSSPPTISASSSTSGLMSPSAPPPLTALATSSWSGWRRAGRICSARASCSSSPPSNRAAARQVGRVVLPQGSKDIQVSAPFPTQQRQEVKYSHLDVVGRPVVVLEKPDVIPEHNLYFPGPTIY